jgi:pilus assembly protein Flp/PilA
LPEILYSPPATTPHSPTKEIHVLNKFNAMLVNEDGQGLVEYALIIALVSIVAIAALRTLGTKASNSLTNASNQLS